MFPHLGPMELVIILVIALMVFGAGKLPEVGSALGKGIREFKKSTVEEASPELTSSTAPPMPTAAAAAPAAAPVTAAAATPVTTATGAFCPKCGAQASADNRFCAKCGASLPTAAA